MFYRFLLLFAFSFSFSQDSPQLYTIDSQNYDYDHNHFIKVSNIGDPLLFLMPSQNDTSFSLNHYSGDARKIDYCKSYYNLKNNKIYSHIFYTSTYQEGGLLETFLTRPIGENIKLNFLYNNLSSLGFYANQKNQHSYLNILVNYFSHHNPFSFSFSFSSNNGFYNQNGGLKTLDPGLDSNLMSTYLNSETIIKNRKLKIDQAYRLHSGLKFTHNFLFSSFYRNYIDESPSSYHYSLNPLYFSHNNSYKDSILFKKMVNSFVFSSHYMKLAINHNNYIVNNHDLNKLGDIDISFSNTDTFFTQNNIDFIFNFCPIGHNKNNFIIDLDFNKEIKKTNNTFSFLWTLKKPNFFHYRNDELNSFDWNQFSSIRTISLKVKSSFDARSLMFSAICDQYSNYFYFDTIVSPNQAEDNVLYFNMKFQKKWQLKNLILHSTLCFQHSSDEEVLSVPLFLFDQKISYDRLLFSDVRLLSLVSIQLFSKYYMPSYFPLADVFYQQQQNKTGMIPLMSLDLSLYKKHVSFGFIVDNINSFFYKDESLILNYILPPANLRITIKWQFLD